MADPSTFAPLVELTTGAGAHAVSSGDVNSDGFIDLAVANAGTDSVSVLLGLGDGRFQGAVNYGVVGDQPKSVVLADVNGDGLLDLLTANQGTTGTISILYNNPNSIGTFLPAVIAQGVAGAHELAIADVDLDGDLDVAVSGWGGSIIRVLLNNGTGGFSSSNSTVYTVGSAPHSLQFGDFNADGRPDLAVANTVSNSVTILLNGVGSSIGSYTTAATYVVGTRPHSIRVGDVNGDGILDLATANESSNNISVLIGRGDGTFTSTTPLSTGLVPKGVAIADVNGDGFADLLTANTAGNYPNNSNNPGGSSISIHYGEGQGVFSAPVSVTTGNTPFAITADDFNNDGLLDLATANWFGNNGAGSVGVLINTSTAPPVNDVTAPTAILTASDINAVPASSYTFTVLYSDPSGVNVASIDNADIRVTGPNGYSQLATRVSTTPTSNATSVTATYTIAAPGGSWDSADNGSYAVSLLQGSVSDTVGNATAAASLGSFAVNISNTVSSTVYLSDLTPTATTNGWGPYERDRSNGETGATDGRTLTLNGTTYAKGLGVHASSSLTYALGGNYNSFQSFIGVDDEVGSSGNVIFIVRADGNEIFRSAALTGASATQFVDLDVAGVQSLVLVVEPNGTTASDHANWADAKLISGPTQPPVNDGTPPTATLTASDINAVPASSYTFTVRYNDPAGVSVASIDNADIRVTGPNGYAQTATRVSTTPTSNATSVTATYTITAPGGSWDIADNGSYAVSLLQGSVSDTFGNATPAASLGSFAVNIGNEVYLSDLTPTASTNGWGPYERDRSNGETGATDGRTLTLNGTTYAKGLGVHASSSLTYALGGNYNSFQSFIGVDDEVGSSGNVIFIVRADGNEIFRSAALTGASATQFVDLNVAGVQTLVLVVEPNGTTAFDHANWADAKLISGPTQPPVNDGTPPTATLTASDINAIPASSYTFTVRYNDPAGVSVASIDNADIRVTGPNGYAQTATRVSTTPTSNATSVTATYTITAPGGSWDSADNGSYAVSLLQGSVSDTFGNATPAASLGSFAVNISNTVSNDVYLSDLTPTASSNAWGPYERDRSNGETGATDGRTLTLNGTTYAKGLGVHASSSLTYALGGNYNSFQSFIGVDDEVGSSGNVIFIVRADGNEIFRSAALTGASATQFVDLNVAGVQTLELIVDPNGSNASDHADWADAKLTRGQVFRLSSNAVNIIREADGQVELRAERTGSIVAPATMEFTTNEIVGSAIADVDYVRPSTVNFNTGLISFAAGQQQQTFRVTVNNDTEVEASETFTVGIQNPSTGALGAPRTARILIVDDDGPSRISLLGTSLSVTEGAGIATVTLLRSGNRSATARVQLVTIDGTATNGFDYGSVNTTVTFTADSTPNSYIQTVQIPIVNDTNVEPDESFLVQISNPVGATLEGNTSDTVTILDDDLTLGNLQRQTFLSGLDRPTTFDWLPNGTTMLVAQKSGRVLVVANGQVRSTPLIDLSSIVNDTGDRGLLGLAVHPSFGPANPFVYVAYTYDPPQTATLTGNAGPNGNGNRPARVEKLTVDPGTLTVTGREVILGKNSNWEFTSRPDIDSTGNSGILPSGIVNGSTITEGNASTFGAYSVNIDVGYQDNIPDSLAIGRQDRNIRDYLAGDSTSHTIGDLEFGLDGNLYVTMGDGTSYNFQDSRTIRVQDIGNLSGKTLRINPLTGQGLTSNPFYNGDLDSNQSKVFYSGLRNPFRFSIDPVSGLPMLGDVGWNSWEENNTGAPGSNFGWPYYEGPDRTGGYSALPSAIAFYNNGNINPGSPSNQPSVLPTQAFSHSAPDNFSAVMVGGFYSNNSFVYGELLSGRVFSATLDNNRQVTNVSQFDSGASYMVDVKQGPDGFLYGARLFSDGFTPGQIVRWT